MSDVRLDEVSRGGEDPFAALAAILTAYNSTHGATSDWQPLWLFARDEIGAVQGGLRGNTFWSWCFIDTLAVIEAHRGTGLGRRLLSRAEDIARERGCIGIYLWTTSFQAPQFYEKNGYTRFGHLPDLPPGQSATWYMKRL